MVQHSPYQSIIYEVLHTFWKSSVYLRLLTSEMIWATERDADKNLVLPLVKNETYVRICEDTPICPENDILKLVISCIKLEVAGTWVFMLSNGEVRLPEHANVIGTRPSIPNPDMHPYIKSSVASLHGPRFADTTSKAIQYA